MRRSIALHWVVMALPLLVACGSAPQPVSDSSGQGIRSSSADGEPDAVVEEEVGPARPSDGDGRAADAGAAAELAGSLRPIDSPLPSREQLEASYSNPVELLLDLSLSSWPDGLVRANALMELGLFPESSEAIIRLLDVARDESRPPTDRVAALDGLIIVGEAVGPHAPELLPLLSTSDVAVQVAAVRLLGRWPAARDRIRQLAEDDEAHFDVRRFARRALESDGAK